MYKIIILSYGIVQAAPPFMFHHSPRYQLIRPIGAEGLDRRGPAGSCRLFLGPGFRLGARWNRLVETVKTRKKRGKTGEKWARYGLKRCAWGRCWR